MAVIIQNPKRSLWVRVVTWMLMLFSAGFVAGGVLIAQTYGLGAADGGVLKPLAERLAFGGFVALLGVLIGGGMWLYGTLYVSELARSGSTVSISTLSLFGTTSKTFPLSDVTGGSFFHGRMGQRGMRAQTINAPWLTLKLKGRWLPYVIDGQADEIDEAALSKLVKTAMRDWQKDRVG